MFGLTTLKDQVLFWASVVLLLALAGFGFYHWTVTTMLEERIETLQEESGKLTVEVAQLETQREQLTAALDKQNRAVQALITAQEEASARATAAVAKAKAESAKWKKQYEAIINAPKPDPDDCVAFAMKLDQYITVRKQEALP